MISISFSKKCRKWAPIFISATLRQSYSAFNARSCRIWKKWTSAAWPPFCHTHCQGEGISHSSVSVVIYTTPGCCNLAKSFFRERNIEYIEYDITSSQEGLREFKELNGRGVPLIFIGEARIDGYNEQLLRSALEQKEFL